MATIDFFCGTIGCLYISKEVISFLILYNITEVQTIFYLSINLYLFLVKLLENES